MNTTNNNTNNSDAKQEVLEDVEFVEVKTEFVSEDDLPLNEDKTLCKITVKNQFNNFEVKKEIVQDDLENSISDVSFLQSCSSRIKSECNEEHFSYEDYNISETQQNVKEFSQNSEVDEKMDVSKIILQSSEKDKAFTRKNSRDEDIQKQTKNQKSKIMNCQFCNKSFVKKGSLDDHILKQHKEEIKGDMKSVITTKIHTCHICNSYESTKKGSIDQHINSVHNGVKTKIKCQFCAELFIRKQSLDGHILRKHKDKINNDINKLITSKFYVCKICNSYQTTNKSDFDRHFNSAHNEVKITMKCPFCIKSFMKQMSLDGHVLRKHKDEIKGDIKDYITSKIYSCEMCSFESTVKNVLDYHVNSMHKKDANVNNCQFCNKTFTTKRSLDNHLLKHHKTEIQSDIKQFVTSKIYTCNLCSYETTMKPFLYVHISKHTKQTTYKNCKFCNKSFVKKGSLDDHILKQHKQEVKGDWKSVITNKIYTCNTCNSFETTNKGKFDRHVNSVHNEEKMKVKCQFCTKSFIQQASLEGHLLKNHIDKIENDIQSFITSKIHVCQICNTYETTHKWCLDQHVSLVHNKTKVKMMCQFCTESFTAKKSLDGHVLRMHKDKIKNHVKNFITSKIHVCEICKTYETTNKSTLDRHMDSVHNKVKIKME